MIFCEICHLHHEASDYTGVITVLTSVWLVTFDSDSLWNCIKSIECQILPWMRHIFLLYSWKQTWQSAKNRYLLARCTVFTSPTWHLLLVEFGDSLLHATRSFHNQAFFFFIKASLFIFVALVWIGQTKAFSKHSYKKSVIRTGKIAF